MMMVRFRKSHQALSHPVPIVTMLRMEVESRESAARRLGLSPHHVQELLATGQTSWNDELGGRYKIEFCKEMAPA